MKKQPNNKLTTAITSDFTETSPAEILPPTAEVIEKVLITGDLASLSPAQRLSYYYDLCKSLGLNPRTKPFAYIQLDRGLTLYALKDCTEQLRRLYNISLKIVSRETTDGVYVVTAQAQLANGRQDESIGGVPIGALAPQARANAMMKAETKAKRRVTLSICGLGMFDESELDLMHDFQTFDRDEDIKARVEQANTNRIEDSAAQNSDTARTPADKPDECSAQPVTAENFGDVVVHFGKAEGEMIGRKVSELPQPVLQWLYDNYEKKWGNPPSDKDKRLIDAVDFALDTIKKAKESVGATTEPDAKPDAATERTAPPPELRSEPKLPPPALTKQGFVDLLVMRAQQSLGIDEGALCDVLREQGLLEEVKANGEKTTLSDCSMRTLRLLERADQWAVIEDLVKGATQ
jgi:hypothetical protein